MAFTISGVRDSLAVDSDPMAARTVVRAWVVSRTLIVLLLLFVERSILGDVHYYARNLEALAASGEFTAGLREYPLPVLALLGLPWLATLGFPALFPLTFAGVMLAIDAGFTFALWRTEGRRATEAVWMWIVALPLLGPLAITRFDLAPGVLAAAALLLLGRRPWLAGAATAAGAALKLWPVILLPALAARMQSRRATLIGFLGAGTFIGAVCLSVADVPRLLSPMSYQSDRGLQIESVPALPLMIAWVFDDTRWTVAFSRFLAVEVSGPGDSLLLAGSTAATAAFVGLLGILWWRAWRRGPAVTPAAVGWLLLASISGFLVTNKVLSPQYLLWLAPVVVALLTLVPRNVVLRRIAVVLLGTAFLTQLIYPITYGWITFPYWANPLGVAMLTARNAALIWIAWACAREAWRATRHADVTDAAATTRADASEPALAPSSH